MLVQERPGLGAVEALDARGGDDRGLEQPGVDAPAIIQILVGIPTAVPAWAVLSMLSSGGVGLIFGIYPACRNQATTKLLSSELWRPRSRSRTS